MILTNTTSFTGKESRRQVKIIEIKLTDEGYPQLLAQVKGCPGRLFVAGEEDNLTKFGSLGSGALAVVGTRKVTEYGRRVTTDLVSGVCSFGVPIVSGLMYGVDEVAHRACVASGGFTVGVWAGGLGNLFLSSRAGCARKVLERGVLLTEYESNVAPKAWMFPARNRIVAGMAAAVLVTEAASDSGSLITAGFAADYGREVLAVPGPVTSPVSAGVNYLLKNGARLVTETGDILSCLGIKDIPKGREKLTLDDIRNFGKGKDEKKLLELLVDGGKDLDYLSREAGMGMQVTGAMVTRLELKGILVVREGMCYLAV